MPMRDVAVKKLAASFGVLILCGIALGSPASAQSQYTFDREWDDAKGWSVGWNDARQGCLAATGYQSGTIFWIGQGSGNDGFLAIANKDWSFVETGQNYKINFVFDGRRSWDGQMTGLVIGDYRGMEALNLSPQFLEDIARSSGLQINQSGKQLDDLSLTGTREALDAVSECTRTNVAEGASRQDQLNEAAQLHQQAIELETKGDTAAAEPLFRRALAIRENALGPEHPDTVNTLNNLALLLEAKGDTDAAEPFMRRVLAIAEKVLGPDHPATAISLNNLAGLLRAKGDIAAAEPLYRRALAIREKALGPDHPSAATYLGNLAGLLRAKGDIAAAEPLYRRALAIREKALGPDHPDIATPLGNLALLLSANGDTAAAEPLLRRALAIREKAFGPDHPDISTSLNNLALVLKNKGDFAAAEPLLRRALAIDEKALGPEHPDTATSLNNLALLLETNGDTTAAEPLYRRALAIREKALGPDHRSNSTSLSNLAVLLYTTGDYAAAEPLLRRALAIDEKALGPEHPDTATSLNNLAWLLRAKGDYAAAEPLFRRALAIRERALSPVHPDTANSLNSLAELIYTKGASEEALPLFRRAAAAGFPHRSWFLLALSGTAQIDPTEAFSVIQRTQQSAAANAVSQLAARFASGSGPLADLVREEQDLAANLATLDKAFFDVLAKPPAERLPIAEEQLRQDISQSRQRLAAIRDKLAAQFPDYAELAKPSALEVDEVQALLGDDEALVVIDTVDNGRGDYIWAVRPVKTPRLRPSNGASSNGSTGIPARLIPIVAHGAEAPTARGMPLFHSAPIATVTPGCILNAGITGISSGGPKQSLRWPTLALEHLALSRKRSSRTPHEDQINVNPFPKIDPLRGSVHIEFRRCGRPNCCCRDGCVHGPYFVRRWCKVGRQWGSVLAVAVEVRWGGYVKNENQ